MNPLKELKAARGIDTGGFWHSKGFGGSLRFHVMMPCGGRIVAAW